MDSTQSEDGALRQFVEAVIKESGATDIDVAQAVEAISAKIDESIVDELPEETMDKMLALQATGEATDEAIEALLDESGVDPKPIAERVMQAFRSKIMERRAA